jgi:hypothetical protein
MSKTVNDVVSVGTFGLVKDVTGTEGAKKAAGRAAEGQERAQATNIQESARQFDVTQESLKPFQEAGVSALSQQQALIGLSGPEEQEAAFAAFNESPGQAFLRERAERSLVRQAGALGGLGGGNVRAELVRQGVGEAQQDFQNQFGRLGQIAGQGQAATTNIGQFGSQAVGQQGQFRTAGSEARASGVLGKAQAESQFTNQALQLGGQFLGGAFGAPPTQARVR